jgi:hypothetical protein
MSKIDKPAYIGNSVVELAFPKHPDVIEYEVEVQTVRDIIKGGRCVKAARQRYLPGLKAQSKDAYDGYIGRAVFVNSTARIFSTNSGTIIRRSPTLEYTDSLKPYFEEDTVGITSFNEVKKHVINEILAVSRVGVFIEVDEALNKPVPVKFTTENIINWIKDDDGYVTSILIAVPKITTDPTTFDSETKMTYYKLFLDEKGVYNLTKYDENKADLGTIVPSVLGKELNFLPLVVGNTLGLGIEPTKSPMIDIAEINLSHYRTSASLETGRHFVGLPQPIVTGATSEDSLYVGSEKAWVISSKDAKAYYLEFIGQGLDGLAKALKEKEGQMSQFSAQLMDTSGKGSEAEGTVRMRFASDAANLADIADSAELVLNRAYKIIAEWIREPPPVITLNKDFISDRLSYNDLRELTKTWYQGGLSDDEFRYNLKRGEVVPNDAKTKKLNKKEE